MLISFAVTNFKSFRDRSELSLVARPSDRTVKSAVILSPASGMDRSGLLSAAAIYGANASGKTNFLLAIRAMREAVRNSQTDWKPTSRIRIDPHLLGKNSPTEFEIQLIVGDVRYRYGFRTNEIFFEKEWLYSYPNGRERELFVRETIAVDDDEFEITVAIGGKLTGKKRDLESTSRRVRQNSLFLSAAAQDNQTECQEIYQWFAINLNSVSGMNISRTDQSFTSMMADTYDEFRELLLPLMKLADSSITDIMIENRDKINGKQIDADNVLESTKNYSADFVLKGEDGEIVVDFERESRGVKRLYALALDILSALHLGRLTIVDELETSMHAHVASQILALFQNKSSNPRGAQLIFTTHETRLLNLQHLRRDQVWFCEREGVSSKIYSLLEFSPRTDENFEAGYLRGRYGAVPKATIDPAWIVAINRLPETDLMNND